MQEWSFGKERLERNASRSCSTGTEQFSFLQYVYVIYSWLYYKYNKDSPVPKICKITILL